MTVDLDSKQLGAMLGAIPGSVEPGIWTIRHSSGMRASVDLEAHDAHIPGALTIWDAAVTQHEQGHIRWDLPLTKLGMLAPALTMASVLSWYKMMREWVIDLRLVIAAESDPTAQDPRIGMDQFDWTTQPDPATLAQEQCALMWCQYAYVYTGSQSVALQNHTAEHWSLLTDPIRAMLSQAFTAVTDRVNAYDDDISAMWAIKIASYWDATRVYAQPTPRTTQQYQNAVADTLANVRNVKITAELLKDAMAPQGTPAPYAMKSAAQMVATELAPTSVQDSTEGKGADVAQTFASTPRTPKGQAQRPGQKSKAEPKAPTRTPWGKDVVICDHLSLARPGKRLKAPKGASEEGVVIVDLPRVFQDGRPFKTASRPAGTIIVDTSGSMHWTTAQLDETIRRAPGVVVVLYNANDAPHGNGARLCIVARDGRRADIEDIYRVHRFSGGNNGSDAPALRWLADRHQKGPKFIVSDGEFWSNDGSTSGDYQTNTCTPVMKAGKILRVPTLDDMILIMNHRPAMISSGGRTEWCTKRRANNR